MDSFIIRSGALEARVLSPESPEYGLTRFNHAGFIPQVTYKGHAFGTTEMIDPEKPTTRGAGLCCEYQSDEVETSVPVGEKYLRPGAGYVQRMNDPWTIYNFYPPYDPFDTAVTAQSDRALFVTETDMVAGYAYRECRLIRLSGNQLFLTVHLENQGEKPLILREFCHNLLTLPSFRTSSKHHLSLPCVKEITIDPKETDRIQAEEGGVRFTDAGGVFYNRFMQTRPVEGFAWRLWHEDSPLSVSETCDFTPTHVAIWGLEHVISAEVFHRIALEPGESADWARTWTFDA